MDFQDLMEPVAKRLCGEPNKALSNGNELRYGTNGSLSVKVGGQHKGTWTSHETGEGGGVLDLIAFQNRCDKKSAAEWLKANFPDFAGRPEQPTSKAKIAAVYPYHDEHGELLFEVVRMEPKDFRQRKPDGSGGHSWSVKGVRMVPYRLPEITEAMAKEWPVYIVEGEKDADRLYKLGVSATCNAGGAGKWRDEFADHFLGAYVVLVPDNDDVGREHMESVARSLTGKARSIRVLTLPNLPRKGDISDWLNSGGTIEGLHDLTAHAPEWQRKLTTRLPLVWFGDEDSGPQLSWLVKGLLVNGGLSTIYGPPGSSKSFLALDMALHIAHGREWFGRKVAPAGVIYISGEGGSGMRLRMKAWRQEKTGDRVPFGLIPESVNLFDDDADIEKLMADVLEITESIQVPIRLIVLDTLSRMIGSGDEDKASNINLVVQRAEKIQRATGAHVLIVHHSGKDKDRGMRGSNALLGAVDAAIEITRHESGLCEGKIAKIKDGGEITPFKYELRKSVLGLDEDGEDITSCVIEASDATPGDTKGKPRLSSIQTIALEALRTAIIELGVSNPITSTPTGTRAVRIEQWRGYSYRKGIADSEEARKKAFQRVRTDLQAKQLIVMEGDWVWLVN